jgi:AraC-like DNA-binding protein
MQGVPVAFDYPRDAAEFRRPAHNAGVELFRAHIVRHAFEPHTHAAFGIGVIESGAERFAYRGTSHVAAAGSLVLMNPDELHTGQAESDGGWRYAMVYLDPDVLREITGESWWFAEPVRRDWRQAGRVSVRLARLWAALGTPLAFDCALAELVDGLRRHAKGAQPTALKAGAEFARVIDYMHEHLANRLTLPQLAAVADLSPFYFLRRFKARHHATPQQMLMALRLLRAKRLLETGDSPAHVAAEVGLTDQAHLTRSFVRRYGVTPARYQRQIGRAQSGTRRRR